MRLKNLVIGTPECAMPGCKNPAVKMETEEAVIYALYCRECEKRVMEAERIAAQKKQEEERRRQRAIREKSRKHLLINGFGRKIGEKVINSGWRSFTPEKSFRDQRIFIEILRDIRSENPSRYFLSGPTGVGKTHLAAVVAYERALLHPPSKILIERDRAFRERILSIDREGRESLLRHVKESVEMAIIMEFGAASTDWGWAFWNEIFDHWNAREVFFLIESNFSPEHLISVESRVYASKDNPAGTSPCMRRILEDTKIINVGRM